MDRRFLTIGAITAVMAFAPAMLHAQADAASGTEAAAPAATAEPAGQAADAEAIAAQIQRVQQQALQDPSLRAANQALSQLIMQTLPKVDPNFTAYAARASSIKTDVAEAQAAQDNARLNELAAEATQLQANVAAAQAKAREDAAVKEKLEEFRVMLFTKMVEIDPNVQDLVAQLEELQRG